VDCTGLHRTARTTVPRQKQMPVTVKGVLADPATKSFHFVDVPLMERRFDGAKEVLACDGLDLECFYDGPWIDAPYWSFTYEFQAMCREMPDVSDDDLDGYHCVECPKHFKMPGRVLYVKRVHTVPYGAYMFKEIDMTEEDMAMIRAIVRFVDPVV
jgi:hypothetical protein